MPATDKYSSLLRKIVSYARKKVFYQWAHLVVLLGLLRRTKILSEIDISGNDGRIQQSESFQAIPLDIGIRRIIELSLAMVVSDQLTRRQVLDANPTNSFIVDHH
jgi:hypothetical protein